MYFNPVSEEEIETALLAPEGVYHYRVIQAKDGISHAGNDKIDLTLKIWNADKIEYGVFTNLSLIKLLKHFCDVNQMQDQYKLGHLDASMCEHKSGGCVMIGIDAEKPNPKGGVYKAKNIVKDYIVAPHGSTTNPLPPKDDFISDDLPF